MDNKIEEKKNSISYYGEVIAKDCNAVKTFFDVYSSRDAFFDIDAFTRNVHP